MTNARIQTHADHINTVDFPAFQASVSGHVMRHKAVVNLYHKHLHGLEVGRSYHITYCHECGNGKNSNNSKKFVKRIYFNFVMPQLQIRQIKSH